ncbi:MAG TPA: Trx7/PDZ domain-containing (seleno)protein [Pirellulaceae bacterium]|nr:Trx7/PDZ domain-containing (seleno)protein [Pirellulaceae bacterium]
MRVCRLVSFAGVLLASFTAAAAESELQQQLKDDQIAPHWLYCDLPAAMAQAKERGKPILVVLRCVPCPPGKTLDAAVMQPNADLEKLEQQFVCVRLVHTKGLDLSLFEYDFDMSWAAMFIEPDGTVLGRYGTRVASGKEKSDSHISMAGFRSAAERALALHKNFPANKGQLAGKRSGRKLEYAVPEEIPGLDERAKGEVVKRENCIHCHMIREFALRAKWEAGKLTAGDLKPYPMPERIGLTMDVDDGQLVKSVAEGSAAEEAGIEIGDQLVSMSGQPLVSLADIQWVLHSAADEATIPVTLRRDGEALTKKIEVGGNWKQSDIAWRASSWYGLRQGLKTEPLSTTDKKARGIDEDSLALAVKGLHGKGGPKLEQAGVRMNDVIVAVDDRTDAMSESDFLIWLRLNHGPKDSVRFTVLRGENRRELTIPMW